MFAKQCRGHGARVTAAQDLDAAFAAALAIKGPSLVEIVTDPELGVTASQRGRTGSGRYRRHIADTGVSSIRRSPRRVPVTDLHRVRHQASSSGPWARPPSS